MTVHIDEMARRRARIQEAALKEAFGGLLVFANQMRTTALHYVSGYTLFGSRAFCYLPLSGPPSLAISEAWDCERAINETGLSGVTVLGSNWAREVAALCRGRDGRLGIVGRETMGRRDLAALEEALGEETLSATRLMEDMAVIKSPYECSLIREAAKMADAGFMRALEVMREGMADFELVAEIDYVMRRMGARDNFQMIAVGKQNSGMFLPFGKKIEAGDLILFEITPANGPETYSAQLCKTAVYGEEPDSVLREKYRLLIEALEESLSVIKPGVKVGEVARIQNGIIEKAGYDKYCQPPFMRARGHGFGLGRIEIDEDSPFVFAEGMSLVIHPNQFLPETGYLALGEHILVSANGIERLTATDKRIYPCLNQSRGN